MSPEYLSSHKYMVQNVKITTYHVMNPEFVSSHKYLVNTYHLIKNFRLYNFRMTQLYDFLISNDLKLQICEFCYLKIILLLFKIVPDEKYKMIMLGSFLTPFKVLDEPL